MITRRATILGLGASLPALALVGVPFPPDPKYHVGKGKMLVLMWADSEGTYWREVDDTGPGEVTWSSPIVAGLKAW